MVTETDDLKSIIAASRVRNSNNAVSSHFKMIAHMKFGHLDDGQLIDLYQGFRDRRSFVKIIGIFTLAYFATLAILIAPRYQVMTLLQWVTIGFVGLAGLLCVYQWYANWKKTRGSFSADHELVVLILKERSYEYLTK